MLTKILGENTTPGSYDNGDYYLPSDFAVTRGDSMVRFAIALQAGSASTVVAIEDATGGEIHLNGGVAIDASRLIIEDVHLPMGRAFNVKAKANGTLLNYVRVIEVYPEAS